ncbi:putative signal transduction protein with a C-terminal ATPase domain [Thiorhodovibrio frisius]|uniref:Putative signal transduction protein with a C-terminal ATPase domain n=2 Tax=Thiorhodovibrio frisius TaxID=631362 RepID=H8Z440_9GAMM|nr:putative signal transduction protein with a C-terminal ATPase domain [Thiorhodovibrio frisius]WPL20842.1 Sensor histidine kinase YpdA [Thiorhodovibrio frisius]
MDLYRRISYHPSRLALLGMIWVILLLLGGCATNATDSSPRPDRGVLDLRGWTPHNGPITLRGEWAFHWRTFLPPNEARQSVPDRYVSVPSTWNHYQMAGENLPGHGYASYRLQILTDLPVGTLLALQVHSFSSAYRLFVDDLLVAANGTPGTSVEEEQGQYRPLVAVFSVPDARFELLIQVSNHHYARGGFWADIFLGDANTLIDQVLSRSLQEAALFGALLVIGFFYAAVYFLLRRHRYLLTFALFCLILIVILDMAHLLLLTRLAPAISIEQIAFLHYSSTAWGGFLLLLYTHQLFSTALSAVLVRIWLAINLVAQSAYLLLPMSSYSAFGPLSNLLDISVLVCTLLVCLLAVRARKQGGLIHLTSLLVLVIINLHDVLYLTNAISSIAGSSLHLGVFVFLLLQLILQAQRISLLNEQNQANEMAFLRAQINPHFLYNTLNTVISLSRRDMEKARQLLYQFSEFLRQSFDFKNLNQHTSLDEELAMVELFVSIQRERFGERVQVKYQLPGITTYQVPANVLQPIVENAINHGILPRREGGIVAVSVEATRQELHFVVSDDGIGMDPVATLGRQGDQRQGIGLNNINRRLLHLYGRGLEITSTPDQGTRVRWSIPLVTAAAE